MANPRYPAHRLVEKLTGEPDQAVLKLLGYFGSTHDGVVKFYPDLDDLSFYYAIHEDDIVHVEEASADELPNDGSAIWVKANARVERCVNQRTSLEARFLTGRVSARMARGPAVPFRSFARQAAGPQGQVSIYPCSLNWDGCLPTVWPCTVGFGECQPPEFATVNSCDFTCGGATCGYDCISVRPDDCRTDDCSLAPPPAICQGPVWSRDVCPR
jgi:hypothetical protein